MTSKEARRRKMQASLAAFTVGAENEIKFSEAEDKSRRSNAAFFFSIFIFHVLFVEEVRRNEVL